MTTEAEKRIRLLRSNRRNVSAPVKDEPREPEGRESPAHRFVRQLREKDQVNYRTTAEVAEELGVSTPWVRKIQRQGLLPPVPSKVTQLGKITIYLYTPDDVEIIRKYLVDRQAVYTNVVSDRVQTWEEVKSRREHAAEAEDRAQSRHEDESAGD